MKKQARTRMPKAVLKLRSDDTTEIIATAAHIPDRDQEFRLGEVGPVSERWVGGAEEDRMQGTLDEAEGDTGVIPDPAFDRDGADRMLRSSLGDTSVEEHMTPAARAGQGAGDDPRGIEHMGRAELRRRAAALGVPGRSKMTRSQLSAALHGVVQH